VSTRLRDSRLTVYDLGGEFLVRCPRCGGRARVASLGVDPSRPTHWIARCTCLQCGYQRERPSGTAVIHQDVDWYFGLPLWLRTPCRGHTLWAYNAQHLAFLDDYVRATFREAPSVDGMAGADGQARNRTLASRLPRWIKSGRHREDILAGIERLKRLLD
jgi:hypothetical protein